MSLRKYRAFLQVAQTGSITSAAAALSLTQSGVTQLVNALEKELGTTLLERTKNGSRLTASGHALLPYVKDVIQAEDRLLKASSALTHSSTIRIGTFKSVAVNWLPEIIKEFRVREPDIKIELIDGGYNNMERTFSEQSLDFAFAPLPLKFKCTCFPVMTDRLLAVVPKDYAVGNDGPIPVSAFAKEPVISLTEGIDRDARSVFERFGIAPNIRYRVEDDYALLAMVEKGLGISIVPELILSGTEKNVTTAELDPPATRTIGIAFPDYEHATAASRALAEFAAAWIKEHAVHDLR